MLVCLHCFTFMVTTKSAFFQSHSGPSSLAFPIACFGVSIHMVSVHRSRYTLPLARDTVGMALQGKDS